MDYRDNDSMGESTNASWAQAELQGILLALYTGCTDMHHASRADNDSAQELESLDPQKRELLEARILGRVSRIAHTHTHTHTHTHVHTPCCIAVSSRVIMHTPLERCMK